VSLKPSYLYSRRVAQVYWLQGIQLFISWKNPTMPSSLPAQAGVGSDNLGQVLLAQALEAISSENMSKKGLNSEPLVLMMLLLDNKTLEEQTPIGRHLLHALSHLGICHDTERRGVLLQAVRLFLSASNDYWHNLSSQQGVIAKRFNACKRGKKGEVMNAFEKLAEEKEIVSCCQSLLQMVYPSGARNHVLLDRSDCLLFLILITSKFN
jgi:hypothetical protein